MQYCSKIFSTFIGSLKSKDPNDGTEHALLNEPSAFNDHIKGGFCQGEKVSAADMALGPKPYHLEIALGHCKNWYPSSYINEHVLQPMNADFDHGLSPVTYSNAPCHLKGSAASIRIPPSLLRRLSHGCLCFQ
ncbi:hypothetical protein NC653_011043 [Populus alba x Populus x berolinensis]|uniref:glutathione transferase n=1 Tax=Populus alba x Populus x berolinensis TaxID=444605 RepID=A0AAD6R2H6_9ROSI|nr:hypothetical protein NC653_011043 [Populus alba x Populus x berolinensis]